MPHAARTDYPADLPGALPSARERRVTNQVLKLWKCAKNKRNFLAALNESPLWEHCFLCVVDNYLEYSVIIDQGRRAAKGLRLDTRKVKPLVELPRAISSQIHRLGLDCRNSGAPAQENCEQVRTTSLPLQRYRLALLPLNDSSHPHIPPRHNAVNTVGVFTYQ